MWNEINAQTVYANHGKGGVAPRRHEIVGRAYIEKIKARHEAEQRAANTGVVMEAISRLWELTRVMFVPMQYPEPPATRTGTEHPAE